MERTKRKFVAIPMCILSLLIFFVAGLFALQTNTVYAAENTSNDIAQYEIVDYEIVEATYEFIKLNSNECSVRITNKAEATVAHIPSIGNIKGKDYIVTEIAANGFVSSSKLVEVVFPGDYNSSISFRKIGNTAFANCPKLKYVDLKGVKEIADNAFILCDSLERIVIPTSVKVMGSYIFEDNNTQVEVRASKANCTDWKDTWNLYNYNQDVHYESKSITKPRVKAINNALARTGDPIGYVILAGKPDDDKYDNLEGLPSSNYKKDDIIIPATITGPDNLPYPILGIAKNAFRRATCKNLIIQHSDKPIFIGSGAFGLLNSFDTSASCNIIINRDVVFKDATSFNGDEGLFNGEASTGIFSNSIFDTIILPEITEIPSSMFSGCGNLLNIFFKQPDGNKWADTTKEYQTTELLSELDNLNKNSKVEIPDTVKTIGNFAFQGVNGITELHLSDKLEKVGNTVLGGWNDEFQTVYIHNTNALNFYEPDNENENYTGWSFQWNSTFENIILDAPYYIFNFKPNLYGVSIDAKTVFKSEIQSYVLPTPTSNIANFKEWTDNAGNKINTDNYDEWATDKYDNGNTYFETIELTADWIPVVRLMSEDGEIEYLRIEMPEDKKLPTIKVYFVNSNEDLPENTENTENAIYLLGKAGEFIGFLSGGNKYEYDADSHTLSAKQDFSGCTLKESWCYYKTEIIYNYNGGKPFLGAYPSVIEYGDTLTLGEPYKFECNFEGWYSDGIKLTDSTLSGIGKKQITLTAHWSSRENVSKRIILPTNVNSYTIQSNGYYTLSNSYSGNYSIIILSNVQEVHLSCSTYTYFPNLTITIKSNKYWPSQCNLYLENIGIKAPTGQAAIYMCRESDSGSDTSSGSPYIPANPNIIPYIPPIITAPTFPIIKPTVSGYSLLSDTVEINGHSCLNLYAYGDVKLYGGDAANKSDSNAGCAIFCEQLMVKHMDELHITGGDASEVSGDAGCGVVAVYSAKFYDESYIRGFIEILGGNKTTTKLMGSTIIYDKKRAEGVCILIGN